MNNIAVVGTKRGYERFIFGLSHLDPNTYIHITSANSVRGIKLDNYIVLLDLSNIDDWPELKESLETACRRNLETDR